MSVVPPALVTICAWPPVELSRKPRKPPELVVRTALLALLVLKNSEVALALVVIDVRPDVLALMIWKGRVVGHVARDRAHDAARADLQRGRETIVAPV